MSLTAEQELEVYSNIKVIASNCVTCKTTQSDHEKRIRFLEQKFWLFYGIACAVSFFVNVFGLFLIKTCLS